MANRIYTLLAMGFGKPGEMAKPIDQDSPLPVSVTSSQEASITAPLIGVANASGSVGPFAPQLGRPIIVTLTGAWAGSVQLLRSVDGGATKTPLTVGGSSWGRFSANCNEPVWQETEAGVTYWLAITLSSGAVNYRVAQ